jgi:hypothetical protein
MRDAYSNISLSDGDWRLMCETVERAVVAFQKCGAWPADIDCSPRMGEVDEAAWDLRKQMGIIADQRNVLEDALYELWRDPSSESARDEAARLLAVGPYDPIDS